MEYVIIDLEWNQPLSYRDTVRDPVFLNGEIIQIGAVKLNDRFQVIDTFASQVHPVYYPALTYDVRRLTGLQDWMLTYAPSFPEAAEQFRRWCGNDFAFLIWGTDDIQILRSNLMLHGIEHHGIPKVYNLQVLFSCQISHLQKQCSLEKAVLLVGERQEMAHDALGDAMSTYLVCKHLDMKSGLESYSSSYFGNDVYAEQCILEDDYLDIFDALEDDYVVSFECPDCGELVWCEGWYPQDSHRVVGTGFCSDGTEYFARLKFSAAQNGFMRVKRTSYYMTDELRELYEKCKRDYEEKEKVDRAG